MGKNSYYRSRWRSPERVRERCEYMRELAKEMPPLKLKEIALKVKERFGAETATGIHSGKGRPMNHSTILAHIKNRCRCAELRSWEHTGSAPADTGSPTETPSS